jgi:hypothetical protein
LAHAALAEFHRRVNERMGRPASPLELPAEQFDRLLAESLAASDVPVPLGTPTAALREADRRLVRRWLADYRDQYEKYEKAAQKRGCTMTPELLEVGFGQGRSTSQASVDAALEITFDDETVRISGRVDRADTGLSGRTTLVTIIDYKIGSAGRFNDEQLAAGRSLQLPLYAMAACELLLADRDAVPLEAGYWRLRDGGFKGQQAIKMYELEDGRPRLTDSWDAQRRMLDEVVVSLVRGLRRGEFPVYNDDEHCTGTCDLYAVCRINPLRALEKKWQPSLNEPTAGI